jgi:hypothetical protein
MHRGGRVIKVGLYGENCDAWLLLFSLRPQENGQTPLDCLLKKNLNKHS